MSPWFSSCSSCSFFTVCLSWQRTIREVSAQGGGVLPGLSWEAEEGEITSPFTITSGYVSQPVTTDVSSGGIASYRFNLTLAGDYVIQAWVDALDDSTNSFFVNIDEEPVSPSMIWDIYPWPTNGFVERTVSWRGGGTYDNNQFVPKVFSLSWRT